MEDYQDAKGFGNGEECEVVDFRRWEKAMRVVEDMEGVGKGGRKVLQEFIGRIAIN